MECNLSGYLFYAIQLALSLWFSERQHKARGIESQSAVEQEKKWGKVNEKQKNVYRQQTRAEKARMKRIERSN